MTTQGMLPKRVYMAENRTSLERIRCCCCHFNIILSVCFCVCHQFLSRNSSITVNCIDLGSILPGNKIKSLLTSYKSIVRLWGPHSTIILALGNPVLQKDTESLKFFQSIKFLM